MRRIVIGLLACALVATGLLIWWSGVVCAADTPLAGNWKIIVVTASQDVNIWIIEVEQKDDKSQVKVAAELPNFKGTVVESALVDDRGIHLTLKANGLPFYIDAYLPPGEKKPEKLLGSVGVRGQREFIQLERTTEKAIDPKKAASDSAAAAEVKKVQDAEDPKAQEAALKELVKKHPTHPAGYVAMQQLLGIAIRTEKEGEVRAAAEPAIQVATRYGPEARLNAVHQVARALARSEKLTDASLDYARQAAKLLTDGDPAALQISVLKTLTAALKKAGKEDDLKPIRARIAKLDDELDRDFIKNNIPFKVEMFAGRQAKSDRVVLVELFTGAQCPPCVAADVAFDAMIKTYKPSDVILLQYHLHVPGPDPLTNKDSEKRAEYYGVEGTPSLYISGKEGPPMGGGQADAEDRYKTARKVIDAGLETPAPAKLKLSATRKEDKIDLQADYSDLAKPGDDMRLRFVVVEDIVRYPGSNGQRFHHHVVRGFPGGVDGVALKEKSGKQNLTLSLAELRKTLSDYMADYAKNQGFLDEERPLELKNLKVVALIQDNGSKEVLQAAQVDLAEGK